MSKTQTVREWLAENHHELELTEECRDGDVCAGQDFLDCHIIPGADAVVTPQGLEGCAARLAAEQEDDAGIVADWAGFAEVAPNLARHYLEQARAAIEAAGIEVVDEVLKVLGEVPGAPAQIIDYGGYGLEGLAELERGDTIFIKRAVTGHCDKEE